MEHLWTIAAQGSAIDVDTNALSAFNIVEELHLPGAPPDAASISWIPFPMVLVSYWRIVNGKGGYFKVRVENSQGETILADAEEGAEVDFRDVKKARTRLQLPAFPIKGEGTYCFVITQSDSINGDYVEAGRVPVEVSFAPAQSTNAFSVRPPVEVKAKMPSRPGGEKPA